MNQTFYAIGLIGILLLAACARWILHILVNGTAGKYLSACFSGLFIIYTIILVLSCSIGIAFFVPPNADIKLLLTTIILIFAVTNLAVLFSIIMYSAVYKKNTHTR